jgi:hypothetical protein
MLLYPIRKVRTAPMKLPSNVMIMTIEAQLLALL